MAVKKKKVKAAADQVDKQQNGVSEQKAADGDGKHKQAAAQGCKPENVEVKKEKKSHKKRRKGLYKRLAEQLEFYFSDANLRASSRKDGYMMQLLKKDPWVPLSVFEKFNKIKTMIADFDDGSLQEHLVKALEVKKSTLLELSADNTKVKRISKLEDKSNVEECTLYIENISSDASHDGLKQRFQQFGPVAYVSLPKYRNSQKAKGFAFIEFEALEGVKSVLKACGVKEDDATSLPDPASLASIRTFNQENADMEKENDAETLKRKHEVEDDDFDAPKRLRIDENQKKQKTDKAVADEDTKEIKEEETPKKDCEEDKTGNENDILSLQGYRILTKTQWRRLRNQYLNQQRKNVSAAKALMRKAEFKGNKSDTRQIEGKPETKKLEEISEKTEVNKPEEENTKPKTEFVPGLILRIEVDGGIDEVKELKRRLREVEEVAYVDAKIGHNQFHVRCKSEEQTDKLVELKFDKWELFKLKDTEEEDYWKKIAKDMEDKKSGKVVVPKVKKKKRLMENLESFKNSHVHFD